MKITDRDKSLALELLHAARRRLVAVKRCQSLAKGQAKGTPARAALSARISVLTADARKLIATSRLLAGLPTQSRVLCVPDRIYLDRLSPLNLYAQQCRHIKRDPKMVDVNALSVELVMTAEMASRVAAHHLKG